MPELPEVEVLVRHLNPLLKRKRITSVEVRREKIIRPTSVRELNAALIGAEFGEVTRRGKYLLFELLRSRGEQTRQLLGHLGMTGRMYLVPAGAPLPKHAAVVLGLGRENFVFEDTRYFGRFTLDVSSIAGLGPEPLGEAFDADALRSALSRSTQAIKVKLLDQTVVAGVGNIYASEALFRAGISPRKPARKLSKAEASALVKSIRAVLAHAVKSGSTIPLDFAGAEKKDGLFYYGSTAGQSELYEERMLVYDRAGKPCSKCRMPIRRIVQATRSTYFCPTCQK